MDAEYVYQGECPVTARLLRLPRSDQAVEAARALMASLETDEGKMFGVLVARDSQGQEVVLQAFSGAWNGHRRLPGWVDPIFEPVETALERATLPRLESIRHDLARLDHEKIELEQLRASLDQQQAAMAACHREARQRRAEARQAGADSAGLDHESRLQSLERRQFKRERKARLAPLEELLSHQQRLRRERRQLSRRLQSELHQQFDRALFADLPWSLASLFPRGTPTGTGECCAPKLLYAAALQGLEPLGLAEFWWGPASGQREPGQFYAACRSRCQPLLGPLLAGARPLEILYDDAHLIAVDKPPGVLTVPGQAGWNQDSVLTRLGPGLLPVHRLDLETSGVVVFARSRQAQVELRRQFQERRARKTYLAELARRPAQAEGLLDHPIAKDPARPGCYRLHPAGQPSQTLYRSLAHGRVEFSPLTGRSHQIRVHAAFELGCPIRGDRLYGSPDGRLRLHAARLEVAHPTSAQPLCLEAPVPF
ncbi:MAG: RluA family pseudouridine synthase [Candidatus Eremiobacteraeota bacterium]|nr:RluA family pseudouridine synthase [Candidatus Eremiobacteraeota bacterium]